MRPSIDQWALTLAEIVALRATCIRRHVGCVLLDNHNHIIATGYNGRTVGLPHCQDGIVCVGWEPGVTSGTNLDACEAIHAEQNALLQCGDVHEIHTCYTTHSPCLTCTKLLLNTSCQRIVFRHPYAHTQAQELWLTARPKDSWINLSLGEQNEE